MRALGQRLHVLDRPYLIVGVHDGHQQRVGTQRPDELTDIKVSVVVDPEGRIKLCEIHDNGIGRDAKELLRKVQAAQYVAAHPNEVCPAKWQEGAKTIAPSLDLVGKI